MSHGEWAEEDTGVPQLFLQCLNPLPGPTHHSFSKDPPESQVRWRPSPQPSAGLSAGSTLNLLFDDSLYDPEGQGLCLIPFCLNVWNRAGHSKCFGALTQYVASG